MAAVNYPTSRQNSKMGGGMSSSWLRKFLGVWGWVPGKGQPSIELDLVQGRAVDRSGGRNHSWSVSAFMLGLEEKNSSICSPKYTVKLSC